MPSEARGHGVYGSGKTWKVRELKIGQGKSGNSGKRSGKIFVSGYQKYFFCLFRILAPYNIEIFRSRLRRSPLNLTDKHYYRILVICKSISHIFSCIDQKDPVARGFSKLMVMEND